MTDTETTEGTTTTDNGREDRRSHSGQHERTGRTAKQEDGDDNITREETKQEDRGGQHGRHKMSRMTQNKRTSMIQDSSEDETTRQQRQ